MARRYTAEIYRNLPNIVSILGLLPLSLLLLDNGFSYFAALVIYNNVMDDLDGILARELHLTSDFGARLDNVCDAVAHILVAMVVGAHFGGIVLWFSVIASAAILIRVVQRLAPSPPSGIGTPTNELMRHLLLVVLVYETFDFDATPYLVAVFAFNAVSMLVPFAMPHMVRSLAKSVIAVVGVNVVLGLAWGVPETAPIIAAIFFATYLYSFAAGATTWLKDSASAPSH